MHVNSAGIVARIAAAHNVKWPTLSPVRWSAFTPALTPFGASNAAGGAVHSIIQGRQLNIQHIDLLRFSFRVVLDVCQPWRTAPKPRVGDLRCSRTFKRLND